ncbi:uncharacterized protein LOC119015469 isoform X1 [Acanthopagrus latus]|uniref:uncharacterized protein LOC119015469 isoform X1 n=1 Tax=Acanthopagrus latus TaxID=8177 RepID=UPI00187BDFAA|nr:uncharacterized protein LOC119015469 isoform X1 [Acanthopagrus latus]
MRLNGCLTILHMSILAALLVHLEADSEDCEFEIRVRRNTVYKTSIGEELRINCTVIFCNNSPPTVSWFKLGQSVVPVNVSSNSHIKIEWKKIDDSRGISFLVFKKILMSDSGEYQCQGGGSLGHNINVSVSDVVDYNYVLEPHEKIRPAFYPAFPHYAFRVVGIVALIIVVMIIYVASRSGCKVRGVCSERRSRMAPNLSPHHIYENDPTIP